MKNSRKKLFQNVLFCGPWALFALQAASTTVSLPELSKPLGEPYAGHVVPREPAPLTTQPSHRSRPDASQQLAQLTSQWLNQFGQAEVTLSDRFSEAPLRNGRLALLPLHQCPHQLLLTQWGVLRQQAQTTYQMGLGQRWFNHSSEYWGYNLFYDYRRQGTHGRLGIGVEQRSAHSSVTLNGYLPLSSWRIADDQSTQSRPAKGFELRLQRQLRQQPHLRLNAVLEHYVSHSLAQYSPEQDPPSPTALKLGVDYTPLPLLTASYSYQLASGGQRNHQLQCQLIYRLGVPLAQQLDPKQVATAHSLANSRLALIQRNPQIVLEQKAYQKTATPEDTIQLTLPAQQQGVPGETLSFPIQLASSCAVTDWQFSGEGSFLTHGGTLHIDPAQQQLTLVLPNRPGEEYSLQIVANKPNGEESRSNTLQIRVRAAVAPKPKVAAKKPRTVSENSSDPDVIIPISASGPASLASPASPASPASENRASEARENSRSDSDQQGNPDDEPQEIVEENPQAARGRSPINPRGRRDVSFPTTPAHQREHTPVHQAEPLFSSNEVTTNSQADSKDFDEETPAPIPSEAGRETLHSEEPGQYFGRTNTEESYSVVNSRGSFPLGPQRKASSFDDNLIASRPSPASTQSSRVDSSFMGSNETSEMQDTVDDLPKQFEGASPLVHRSRRFSITSDTSSMADDQNNLKISNGTIDINNDPIDHLAQHKYFGRRTLEALFKKRSKGEKIMSDNELNILLPQQSKKILNEHTVSYN